MVHVSLVKPTRTFFFSKCHRSHDRAVPHDLPDTLLIIQPSNKTRFRPGIQQELIYRTVCVCVCVFLLTLPLKPVTFVL